MRRAGVGGRVAGCAILAALLGAPTPGAVGSCGGDDLGGPADAQGYCEEREDLVCVRRWYRRELSDRERDECRYAVPETCARRWWSPECRPTEREARACLNALRSRDTLQTPEDEIDECRTDALCRVREPASGPRSIGDDAGMDGP